MKKKILTSILCMLLVLALFVTGCAPGQEQAASSAPSTAASEPAAASPAQEPPAEEADAVRLEDDFYAYVNQDVLEGFHVPEDGLKMGTLNHLQDIANERLLADLNRMAEAGAPDEGAEYLSEAVKYFELYTDMDNRNETGAAPLIEAFEAVDGLGSVQELSDHYADATMNVLVPVIVSVSADPTGEPRNIVFISSAAPYLPAKSYYTDDSEQGRALVAQLEECLKNLMVLAGEEEADAAQMAADAMEVDRFFGEHLLEPGKMSEIITNGEMTSLEELSSMCKNLDLSGAVTELISGPVTEVKLVNPALIQDMDKLVKEENLDKLKNWMKVTMAKSSTETLSEDFYYALEPYNAMLKGGSASQGAPSREALEKSALESLKLYFPQQLGYYYGTTYVDEQTIADISEMTDAMIEEYRARLEQNDWMSEETKEKALLKLDTMTVTVAYDKQSDISNPVTIASKEEGGTLYDALDTLGNYILGQTFESYNDPYEKTQRQIQHTENPAFIVNAGYMGTMNTIVINAAILQEPVYSKDASDSTNYGAIGAIIGHELSHAFDQTGSMYDETGRINNWWTDEDRAEFERRSQEMVELFDGRETQGGVVNGAQTMTENTADAGGLSVALEALQSRGECDEQEFFESYARIWASKMTDEIAANLLAIDIHAPDKLRANLQLSNFDPFYEAYDISEEDGMYLPPEERVKIW